MEELNQTYSQMPVSCKMSSHKQPKISILKPTLVSISKENQFLTLAQNDSLNEKNREELKGNKEFDCFFFPKSSNGFGKRLQKTLNNIFNAIQLFFISILIAIYVKIEKLRTKIKSALKFQKVASFFYQKFII